MVFCHPYGPLPLQLIGKPAIINLFGDKKARAEQWCGAELREVSKWGRGLTNTVYVANMPSVPQLDLRALVEEEFEPGRGWMPDELCTALLSAIDWPLTGSTVFDGFMGRGTVGKAARALGLGFVGIDIDPARVDIAREYLGC